MSISRRTAIATAAAAVTGLTVAPLAMKAANVQAVLANVDPQIEALIGQLRAANACLENINILYHSSGAEELGEESDILCDRMTDIEVQIIQTPATTLRGLLDKARVAWHITAEHENLDETDPDLYGLDDPDFIWSALQDLERLAKTA